MLKRRLILSNSEPDTKKGARLTPLPILLILAGLILFVGCLPKTPTPIATDKFGDNFTTGVSCPPPCWEGLELDVSDKETVMQTLRGHELINPDAFYATETEWIDDKNAERISFRCVVPTKCGGYVTISTGRLKEIALKIDYDLTLEVAVNRLGPPESAIFRTDGVEIKYCYLELLWPEKKTIVQSPYGNFNACESIPEGIRKRTEVGWLIYRAEEWFTYLENHGPAAHGDKQIKWPGFR